MPSRAQPEPPDALRILDASLNRATEALRVIEDIARFHLDRPALSGELKELRHTLLGALAPDPSTRLAWLEHRDIAGDVGRDLASPSSPATGASETPDAGLVELALRNFQRLKESLRTLEEVSRLVAPGSTGTLERLRYSVYRLETMLPPPADRRTDSVEVTSSLYLLFTPSLCHGRPEEILAGALEGGVDLVQLRLKDAPEREWIETGRLARRLTREAGVPLIVNDRPDHCLLLEADGLHLGQDDLPPREARRLLRRPAWIGLSTHSMEQARAALELPVDYIGVGPAFPTSTKDAGPALGADKVGEISRSVSIPSFAIGGINADRLGRLQGAGVRRIAVSSTILEAGDRESARVRAGALREALDRPSGDSTSS